MQYQYYALPSITGISPKGGPTTGGTNVLEYCLVLGFAVPLILPLTLITFVLHLAVFHRAVQHGFKLEMDAKPSSLYLRGSVVLGCGLLMWFYWENNLNGKELVAAGIPSMLLAAWCLQAAVPVSEAPWAWLVYGPQSTLSYFTERTAHEHAEAVELPSATDTVASALPSMGDAVIKL